MSDKPTLGATDYVVLVIILLISVLIGLYHGFKPQVFRVFSGFTRLFRKSRIKDIELTTTKADKEDDPAGNDKVTEYLTAQSSMGVVPIAFSLLASFFSATGIVGTPAEIYQYGFQFWITSFAYATPPIFGALVTGPFFAKLDIISVFEYFELRYQDRKVKLLGTICYALRNFMSLSIVTYGPATAFSLIMGLDQNVSIALVGFIGTFYTACGGMRAVLWTDLFQTVIMITSNMFIVIKGVVDVGSISRVFEINEERGRFNMIDLNPDPFQRHSFWSLYFGAAIYFTISYCFDQQMVTRFKAAKTKKHAQIALLLNTPIVILYGSLCCCIGLVVFANYYDCDPLITKKIEKGNQYSSYFVLYHLSMIPGIVGLFLGSLLCASLSSISSFLNSLALIIWEDFLISFPYFQKFSDNKKLNTNKLLVCFCGLLSTALCFAISRSDINLAQLNNTLNGTFNAPLLGLFVLSLFFSVTNRYGAIGGTLIALVVNLWVSMGALIINPTYQQLSVSVESCLNETNLTSPIITFNATEFEGFDKFYSLSYMWYTAFGALIAIVFGLLISLATGGHRNKVDRSLIIIDLFGCFKRNKRS